MAADRWNRHRIVIATQTTSMILAFILSMLTPLSRRACVGNCHPGCFARRFVNAFL